MKHVETIKAFIKTLMNSESFHALVVQSAPGWGKSTTIDLALAELGIEGVAVGSYATPLHIYNTLCEHPDGIIILDDCAGLFTDAKTMSILKSATWQSSGNDSTKSRRVAWGSSSDKVDQPTVDFFGKIILLTNVVSSGKETEAFLSRCLSYKINIGRDDVKQMLLAASESTKYYAKPDIAREVALFLTDDSTRTELTKISLRTLKMGYDLAETHPQTWRELFLHLLPFGEAAPDALSHILKSGLSAKEQEAKFLAATGKSRRTYYNYKKRLGMTRPYQA